MTMKSFTKLLSFIFIITSVFLLGDTTQTSTVVSRGVGMTPDAALKDAFVQAVQQVVGVMMSAETMVENDKIIKDNVLTYSDGFVTKYDVLKPAEKNQAGFFEITIKAVVEQKQIKKKLEDAKVLRKEVKGMENVWAQMVTKGIRKDDAELMLINALELLNPVDFIIPNFIDEKGRTGSEAELMVVPQDDGDMVIVSIGVVLEFDHRKYVNEVLPYLKELFDKTCIRKSDDIVFNSDRISSCFLVFESIMRDSFGNLIDVIFSFNNKDVPEKGIKICKAVSDFRYNIPHKINFKNNESLILLNTSKRYNVTNQNFLIYSFPKTSKLDSFLIKLNKKNLYCVVSLKDADDNEIQRQNKKCDQVTALLLHNRGYGAVISPEFSVYGGKTCPKYPIILTLKMDKEDLKDVKSMEAQLKME